LTEGENSLTNSHYLSQRQILIKGDKMNIYLVMGIALVAVIAAAVMLARSFVRGMEKDLEGY
jgi:hypothetical protein